MEINLRNQELSQIPSDVWNHRDVRKLDLSGNLFTTLPDQIKCLRNLQVLNVSDNRLIRLPDSIQNLEELQTLNVSRNQLTRLPYNISGQSLQTLDMYFNPPYDIRRLKSLQTLDVSHNQLTNLSLIEYLEELQVLDVSHNQLTCLPDCLWRLKNLRKLDVSFNRLTHLPPYRGDLKKLQGLEVVNYQPPWSPYWILRGPNVETPYYKRAENDQSGADIEQAEQLLQSGQDRAAGMIAGVALEAYLKKLCTQHNIAYSKRAGLQSLIESLEEEEVITAEKASHMMRLASIRNKCAHSSPVAKREVDLLVREVRKLLD